MKIQCNVCETAEAKVLCCADEAALCLGCDEKIHAANKLASKHQRVPLHTSSPQLPKCDICQETSGFFFCLEDRALLCRKCDIAIHTANAYVSSHQRFLVTGVKVGLESTEPGSSSSTAKSPSSDRVSDIGAPPMPRKRSAPLPVASEYNEILPAQVRIISNFASMNLPYTGGSSAGSMHQWHIDDLLGITDISQRYGYTDNVSSKADYSKRSDSDSSSILRSTEEDLDEDVCLGQVSDSSWAVPQIPSPPTASGLHWPKNFQSRPDVSSFVPDIFSSAGVQNVHPTGTKRQRWQL